MALKRPSHLHLMLCSALKWQNNNTSLCFCVYEQPTQRSRTSNRRTGYSSTTHTSALRVWLSEAPSPHTWRQGRPDTVTQGRKKNRRLRTQGRAVEPRWCWRLCRWPLSINLTLITSYLGLLSRRKNAKSFETKERYRITSVVYIVYTCRL